MAHKSIWRSAITAGLTAALLTASFSAYAINIISGPTFTPAGGAPLAGTLQLTTDTSSRISIFVSDGNDFWERDFYDFTNNHSVPLAGFKSSQTNLILVAVYDEDQNEYDAPQLLTFITPALPTGFPTNVVLTCDPDKMEPGYTLTIVRNRSINSEYVLILDNTGEVVWYATSPQFSSTDVHQLDDGNFLIEEDTSGNKFVEMNLLGQIVHTVPAAPGFIVDSHEGYPTTHGTILYISDVTRSVPNFPNQLPVNSTNQNPPLTTQNIDDNPIVEISATNGAFLGSWSPVTMLDPTRVSYLSGDFPTSQGIDNIHGNAIIEDTNDDCIIASSRDQNAVYKFDRNGQLKWILGPHEGWGAAWQQYLLTPMGDTNTFNWNYGQHGPTLTTEGTILVYNNGALRAMPWDTRIPDQTNYSSAVEYKIDETNKLVYEVWDSAWQTNQDRLMTPIVGKAQWLPQTRDILVTYGYIHNVNYIPPNPTTPDATMVRIIEYTHDPVPQVVFDVSFWNYGNFTPFNLGYFCYRAIRIPDLYAHPVAPAAGLSLREENHIPRLEFSADPAHSYVIQASTNLINWATVGTPLEGDVGDFLFRDLNAHQYNTRFYRVLSQ